jgi:hypothetical protein
MKPRPPNVPALYVEGPDDVSVIAALLKRHGHDTEQGQKHLWIKAYGSLNELLSAMPDTIKTERSLPCGFVLDIDIELKQRWQAVATRLRFDGDPTTTLANVVPAACPPDGYIGKLKDYPRDFGIWLMPDCSTDGQKLEHLIATLISKNDPLWSHAETSTSQAAKLVDDANLLLQLAPPRWERFSDVDKIKAQVRTWLAWQKEPGVGFGAAINSRILEHDSVAALAFLNWLSRLYGFRF